MTDPRDLIQPGTPASCINFSASTEEVMRLDSKGLHYKGQFIADAGEAHQLMVSWLRRNSGESAVPAGSEPTDEELLELMPETMRDEFSYAAEVCSDATGGQVKPGIFRVALNTAALEYARAVLARWGGR